MPIEIFLIVGYFASRLDKFTMYSLFNTWAWLQICNPQFMTLHLELPLVKCLEVTLSASSRFSQTRSYEKTCKVFAARIKSKGSTTALSCMVLQLSILRALFHYDIGRARRVLFHARGTFPEIVKNGGTCLQMPKGYQCKDGVLQQSSNS